MTTEDDFQKMLDANPDDFTTRLVFADWLQERGDERAEGYRALGRLGLRAYIATELHPDYEGALAHRPGWGAADNPSYRSIPRYAHCLLPRDWFDRLSMSSADAPWWKTYYHDPRAAEDDAARAFARLPESRRRKLLAGKKVPA